MQRIYRRAPSGRSLRGWILALGGFVVAVSARSETLTITTEELPPFNMVRDGRMVGVSTDVLVEALAQTGINYKISTYPWLRAYEMALKDSATCVYSTTYTDERSHLFKWVGPLAKDHWSVFALADNPVSVKSLDDLRGYRIGTGKGDALEMYLKQNGFQVEAVVHPAGAANDLNLKKLESRRIDFWAAGQMTGNFAAAQLGLSNVKEVLSFRETALYMACNRSVPDEVIAELNAAVRKIAGDPAARQGR